MKQEKIGPACKDGAGVQLGCENTGTPTLKTSDKQSISDPPTHLIGGPKVIVQNRGTMTLVAVENAPWGWGNLDIEFHHVPLHEKSKAAGRYADELRARIATAAWKEHARRERIKAIKCAAVEAGR